MADVNLDVNLDAVRLWVDAMVSGNYTQGRERLLTKEGAHCCMGVAAAICPAEMVRDLHSYDENVECVMFDGEYEWMPRKVWKWLGFKSSAQRSPVVARWEWLTSAEQERMRNLGYSDQPLRAHKANDVLGWSLEKIGRSVERLYLSGEAAA